MGRIADWFGTLSAAARYRRLERDARELILELTDALEKLNTMAARLAKREARARARAQEAPRIDDQPVRRVVGGRDHKAELRHRAASQMGLSFPSRPPETAPCEGCDDDPPEGV